MWDRLFRKHQGLLLFLLNAPVIRLWSRWVLRIHGDRSSVGGRRIVAILPNAIWWKDGGSFVAEFRTHPKYERRLIHAFLWVWKFMHLWDEVFADRYVPALSFGFLEFTQYPDADPETTTVDGQVTHSQINQSWSTIINGAGTDVSDSTATRDCVNFACNVFLWDACKRGIFLFNTAPIGSGAVISAAVMSIYGAGKRDDNSWTPNVDIYTSNPASNTALAGTDYATLGSTSQTGGNPISYASWNTSGYNAFTFNATGIGNISKTGVSKFGTRNANYDVAETDPGATSDWRTAYLTALWADQAGTTQDPKLVVTYTAPFISAARIIYIARSDGTRED